MDNQILASFVSLYYYVFCHIVVIMIKDYTACILVMQNIPVSPRFIIVHFLIKKEKKHFLSISFTVDDIVLNFIEIELG